MTHRMACAAFLLADAVRLQSAHRTREALEACRIARAYLADLAPAEGAAARGLAQRLVNERSR